MFWISTVTLLRRRMGVVAAWNSATYSRSSMPTREMVPTLNPGSEVCCFPRQKMGWTSSLYRTKLIRSAHSKTSEDWRNKDGHKKSKATNPTGRKRKNKVASVGEITKQKLDKLAAAFDDLARKDGFDDSMAYYADEQTFEKEFTDEDYTPKYSTENNEGLDADFDDDDDGDFNGEEVAEDDVAASDVKELDEPSLFDLSDFTDDAIKDGDERSHENEVKSLDENDDMDDRIAAARRDMDLGRISVSRELENFALMDFKRLGFREEERDPNPTEKVERAKLVVDPMVCSACGSDFQSSDERRPGYLPPHKFSIQVKLQEINDIIRLKDQADSKEWSVDDEVTWLLKTSGHGSTAMMDPKAVEVDVDAMAEEMGIDLEQQSKKRIICKRCHGLQYYGKVESFLRPGWSDEPLISQEKFLGLLRPLREQPCVIIALVDLFDFEGSILQELDIIAGDNPVIVAANKVDLLPDSMGKHRVETWVRRELQHIGIKSLANVGGAVQLISCQTGFGVDRMLEKARLIADEMNVDLYIVGAANAGKSTLLNHILGTIDTDDGPVKKRAGNRNAWKRSVTTSPLPGTTLRFIKVDLGEGRYLYDTPGLLVQGTLTQLLTPEELKMVIPKKPVEPVTFRLESGKCVLIGGLVMIELIGDSKPFLFTFFVSNDIKLHPTDSSRAQDFIDKHVGEMLTPPLGPGKERMEKIGPFASHVIDIEGTGWKEASADIALAGLGWVAVTGPGVAKVRVSLPKAIGLSVRPPLMPLDIWRSTAKYTGSRAVRKIPKRISRNRRKGVGRR